MNHSCRPYRENDLKTLQMLMAELGYSVTISDLRTNIDEIHKKGGEVFIADKKDKAVGSVCVILDARLAEGIYAEIVSLVVSEKVRGEGVGKALVLEAEKWARLRVNTIRVRANVVRTLAHGFYLKQGFKETKTQKVFKKIL